MFIIPYLTEQVSTLVESAQQVADTTAIGATEVESTLVVSSFTPLVHDTKDTINPSAKIVFFICVKLFIKKIICWF
jgi:hypothetical protein